VIWNFTTVILHRRTLSIPLSCRISNTGISECGLVIPGRGNGLLPSIQTTKARSFEHKNNSDIVCPCCLPNGRMRLAVLAPDDLQLRQEQGFYGLSSHKEEEGETEMNPTLYTYLCN
jgi:hypothetical protein